MKKVLLVALALSVSGCSYRIYKKSDVEQYCNVCRVQGRLEVALEAFNKATSQFEEAGKRAAEKTNARYADEIKELTK